MDFIRYITKPYCKLCIVLYLLKLLMCTTTIWSKAHTKQETDKIFKTVYDFVCFCWCANACSNNIENNLIVLHHCMSLCNLKLHYEYTVKQRLGCLF